MKLIAVVLLFAATCLQAKTYTFEVTAVLSQKGEEVKRIPLRLAQVEGKEFASAFALLVADPKLEQSVDHYIFERLPLTKNYQFLLGLKKLAETLFAVQFPLTCPMVAKTHLSVVEKWKFSKVLAKFEAVSCKESTLALEVGAEALAEFAAFKRCAELPENEALRLAECQDWLAD
ncbi:MAG: hypothetical protein A2284_13730 [Deltaproteobacteria bacterium RIFOXYA12_FULL_61_11]|nr:MAG: hypothetical protein A2284_13730 [Deltaproteobacteria bacterium RIFOXYA12_FULL_61_11]